jgi:hypothetical protein
VCIRCVCVWMAVNIPLSRASLGACVQPLDRTDANTVFAAAGTGTLVECLRCVENVDGGERRGQSSKHGS